MSYRKIDACRVCGNGDLAEVLNLGEQALTGVFPKDPDEPITSGPLVLVKCIGSENCGLLQLQHSYDLGEMYGDNYGYRSGLNPSMVLHLQRKVDWISETVQLQPGALIIDIGSNDGTTLGCYQQPGLDLLGIDPTGQKFSEHYPENVTLVTEFFSAARVREVTDKQAEVITSFSMFYDLEDPCGFMREVAELLSPNGIWVFEQSYMPTMLAKNSYDTVCHEHLEFYALSQIKWMADRTGLQIVDVEFNDVNGGSFSICCSHRGHPSLTEFGQLADVLAAEKALGLDTLIPYQQFAQRVSASRDALLAQLNVLRDSGASVAALGASTKGNVLLQYCGLTAEHIQAVGEVNPDKYGHYTPGSLIPIVDEAHLLEQAPDYLLILTWHFRDFFEANSALSAFTRIYPLPQLELRKG